MTKMRSINQDIIVTSRRTAFRTDFLYKTNLDVVISHTNFQSSAEVYNTFHCDILKLIAESSKEPRIDEKTGTDRSILDERRLAQGCYLYMILDFQKRYGFEIQWGTSVEQTLALNLEAVQQSFESHWSKHTCNDLKKGCHKDLKVLVGDAGMKNTRRYGLIQISYISNGFCLFPRF